MDTFRLNPDAVRRALPDAASPSRPERDDAERLAERTREVAPRVTGDDDGEDAAA